MDFSQIDISGLSQTTRFILMLLAAGLGTFMLDIYREWRKTKSKFVDRSSEFTDDLLEEMNQIRRREKDLIDRVESRDENSQELQALIFKKNELLFEARSRITQERAEKNRYKHLLETAQAENKRLKRRLQSEESQSQS